MYLSSTNNCSILQGSSLKHNIHMYYTFQIKYSTLEFSHKNCLIVSWSLKNEDYNIFYLVFKILMTKYLRQVGIVYK